MVSLSYIYKKHTQQNVKGLTTSSNIIITASFPEVLKLDIGSWIDAMEEAGNWSMVLKKKSRLTDRAGWFHKKW